MAGKRIFYIASNELTAVYCNGGRVQLLGDFPATPEGFEMFGEYLKKEPDFPSAFLVDVIEEEFRIDTVPHVMGLDRIKLLERKLAGQFRSTPFRSATIAGREKNGRKDDRVLFSGLTKPETLEPWLNELRQHKVPLMGVFSVPQVMAQLVKSLKIKHANTLVLTIEKGRLLRQTFFSHGEMKISRLTPMSSDSIDASINSIKNEVQRNQQYLGRLQLLVFTEPMQVYLLSEGEQLNQFKSQCEGSEKLFYHALDANDVANKTGLKETQLAGHNEWLFSHLLSKKLPSGNYASKQESAYFSFYNLRRQVAAASVVLALGATVWSVNKVFDGHNLKSQSNRIASETQQIQMEYEQQAARMPPVPYKPRVMRAAVESDEALAQHKPVPMRALALIGQGLMKHSNIELDEVRWNTAAEVDMAMMDEFADEMTNEFSEEPMTSGGSATIKAHLKSFPKNYQMAFKEVESFIKTLKQDQRIQDVKTIVLPLNTDPKKTLVGESQRLSGPPVASFELELVMRGLDREA